MDKEIPDVSIVIPCFNAEDHIQEALRSVQAQDFSSWEAIVVDDASTDESFKMANELAETDSRIRVFTIEKGGVSAARNFGVRQSKGKFITFLDADDLFCERALSGRAKLLSSNASINAAICRAVVVDPDGRTLWDMNLPQNVGFKEIGLGDHRLPINAAMLRRELLVGIEPFDERLAFAEDWLLYARLARKGVIFHYTPEGSVAVKQHVQSTTHQKTWQHAQGLLDVLEIAFQEDPGVADSHPLMEKGYCSFIYNLRRARFLFEWGIRALVMGDEADARKLFEEIPESALDFQFSANELVGLIVYNACKIKCVPPHHWPKIKTDMEELIWIHREGLLSFLPPAVMDQFKPARLRYQSALLLHIHDVSMRLGLVAGNLGLSPATLFRMHGLWHRIMSGFGKLVRKA